MTEPINVITAILKKYNEIFDENEKNENNKIIINNNVNFKKLLLEIDKVEKETKCITENSELFFNNTNIKKIHEMNFIQDINLVTSIVRYRKLEIKKQIRIISLSIQVYKYVLIKIKCYDYFANNNNQLKLNIEQLNMESLENERKICINIFTKNIFENIHFLQDTLCRYVDLENKLQQFKKEIINK